MGAENPTPPPPEEDSSQMDVLDAPGGHPRSSEFMLRAKGMIVLSPLRGEEQSKAAAAAPGIPIDCCLCLLVPHATAWVKINTTEVLY